MDTCCGSFNRWEPEAIELECNVLSEHLECIEREYNVFNEYPEGIELELNVIA